MTVALQERQVQSLFQINGLQNGDAGAFLRKFALGGLPSSGRSAAGQEVVLMWNGPGMFMLESESQPCEQLLPLVRESLASTDATVTDLSSARVIVRASGPNASEFLKKGCPVDVDSMTEHSVASTIIAHFSVLVHCVESGGYDMYVMQTFSADFWHWCRHNAREFAG